MKIINVLSEKGERLDIFLEKKLSVFSRNQIQKAIEMQKIYLNDHLVKPSLKVKKGDKISFEENYFADLGKPMKLTAEKIPLTVLYEDGNILVVNKPAGMVVHPASGNTTGTLVNALLSYDPNIIKAKSNSSNNSSNRPGIVHRLDKDTSGIIIIAKNSNTLSQLSSQLQRKEIKKNYTALVFGEAPSNGVIETNIGRDKNERKKMAIVNGPNGKLAITKYKRIRKIIFKSKLLTLLSIEIPTGRTHQIRVQLKSIGLPIIGDQTYFSKDSKNLSDELKIKRQLLHASKISFTNPKDSKIIEIESKLPNDFQTTLDKFS
jgi:23S rRNA pseudouridine1911/1915/1917 synthase